MWEDLDHELNGKHDDDDDLTENESYDEYDEGYEAVIYEDELDEIDGASEHNYFNNIFARVSILGAKSIFHICTVDYS